MSPPTRSAKTGTAGGAARSRAQKEEPPTPLRIEISKPLPTVPSEFNGDVRDLPQTELPLDKRIFRAPIELEGPEVKEKKPLPGADTQPPALPVEPSAPMPAPLQTFKGLTFSANGAGWPPDTVGDVGPNHFIQAVNTSVGIYNKTGTQLSAFTFNSLWSTAATGTACDNSHNGDPTVIYSRSKNRWIVADFAWTAANTINGPYYECIAVSKTGDPVAGGWWFYAIRTDDATHPWLADYPKMGLWPDGLYMTANMFDCLNAACSSASYKEVRAWAFNLDDLTTGVPVRTVIADLNSTSFFTLMPSNWRGTGPPAGRENLLVSESQTLFAWQVWKFHVDYSGSGSTFSGPTNVSQTSYTVATATSSSPVNALETIPERVMMQNQYRNILGTESLWVNHNVRSSATGPNGIQWAQINVTGGTVNTTPVQQQIYGGGSGLGDTIHRWMGSLAVDNQGNMALAYSASNATLNPDIRYAGRLSTDALNSLPQTETTMLPGVTRSTQSGNCGGSTCTRWGDYSAMSVDPADDCTFWYTTEYYETSGTDWQTRIGSFKFPTCIAVPTAAKVDSFKADGFDDGRVLLRWNSSYEVNNLGYNVYRETNGQRVKINPQLIAGSALMAGPKVALTAGKSYAWGDQAAGGAGARYWLEDIDLSGKSTWSGPIALDSSSGKAPTVEQSEMLSRIGAGQGQLTIGQGSTPAQRHAGIAPLTPAAMQLQNNIAGRAGVKISVRQEGWYRVTQSELVAAGLDPNANPRNLRMFIDGQEAPIVVTGQQKPKLDPTDSVEFYGMGLNSPSTDTHVYWLVSDTQPGLRVKSVRAEGGSPATSFQQTIERKDRTIYFSSLRNGEAENFFGPVVAAEGVGQSLRLTNIAPAAAQPATLDVAVQGVTQIPHTVKVYLNGSDVGTVNFSGQVRGAASIQVPHSSLKEGENVVRLVSTAGGDDVSLIDAVRITYSRGYAADSNRLRFTVPGGQQVTLTGFTGQNVRVVDVTDPGAVAEVLGTPTGGKSSAGLMVTIPGVGQRTLLAFTPEQAQAAAQIKANIPSSWRQPGPGADYVLFTRRDLMASFDPLSAQRREQGLSVALVDIDDAYDEYSFGNPSTQAIKDFLTYAMANWQRAPRYVVMAGDGTFDPKNYLGVADSNVLPVKLIDTERLETVSDDWFADLNNTGLPQISIGRLPVRNPAEAARMVSKIVGYENSAPRNSVLLVADSNTEGYNFSDANSHLRPHVPAGTAVNEIRRGTADDAAIKKQLLATINSGQKIVNYNGHGSVSLWRGNLLTNEDVSSLTNSQSLSLFVVMNCLNAYFTDPMLDSLGERLLRAERGGAAAVWASAGITDPGGQSLMNEEFYRQLFGGKGLTIGEAVSRAKDIAPNPDTRRVWVLLGDPAMKLR